MATEVRTFTADSMQQALDIVRQEMGADAVILQTRQIEKRRMLPWLKSRQEVEITAGVGVNVGSRAALTQEASAAASSTKSAVAVAPSPTPKRFLDADDLAPPPQLLKSAAPVASPAAKSAPTARTKEPKTTPAPTPLNSRGTLPPRTQTVAARTVAAQSTTTLSVNPATTADIHQRLDALQRMITELAQQTQARAAENVPAELLPLYTKLVEQDVDADLARGFVGRLKRQAAPEQLANPEACRALLTAMAAQEIHCTAPILPVRGQRKVVALIGPTGVGKTTTIAKLAANFRLHEHLTVGLVTVDTYRVAAVEQLRTYAEIMDLPMKVVTNLSEMRQALDELSGLDVVLIDTAGRSPKDELKLMELKTLLTEGGVDEIHVVLSLSVGAQVLQATAEKYAGVKLASVILTKLDEAANSGTLLSVAHRLSWPISYVTTGQNVPEDIEPAHAHRLAERLLLEPAVL